MTPVGGFDGHGLFTSHPGVNTTVEIMLVALAPNSIIYNLKFGVISFIKSYIKLF
jgi:hypothetical protein